MVYVRKPVLYVANVYPDSRANISVCRSVCTAINLLSNSRSAFKMKELIPYGGVLPEKLPITQPLKNFLIFLQP
jgi:hypothetical protein